MERPEGGSQGYGPKAGAYTKGWGLAAGLKNENFLVRQVTRQIRGNLLCVHCAVELHVLQIYYICYGSLRPTEANSSQAKGSM